MRHRRRWLVLALLLGVMMAATPGRADDVLTAPTVGPARDLSLVVPDEFVVVFEGDFAHRLQATLDADGRPGANIPAVQQLLQRHGVGRFEREFRTARPQVADSRFPDLTGHYLVKVPAGTDMRGVMAEWAASPGVDHVEPIGVHSVDATPNDPYWIYGTGSFPYDQWHDWDSWGIDADMAWDRETGSPSAVVAILDTGVKYRHSDLGGNNPPGPADNDTQGNVWVNPFEIPGNGIDDDGNGYVDDVLGWDFVAAPIAGTCAGYDVDCGIVDNDPNDGEGHGTFCAGIVSAITNNARAVAGVAGGFSDGTTSGAGNGVKVMCLRIGHRARIVVPPPTVTGVVRMDYAAQAMNYVADMKSRGVNIVAVNCSWGNSNDGGISAAVANLLAHDVMVVCAAGNSNTTANEANGNYLSTVPGVVCVGASDSTGVGASFSNFGPNVDLAAPGVGILSITHVPTDTDTTHMYISVGDGTSFSSPMTCAVAALLESYNPALSAAQKASLLVTSTSPLAPGNTKQLGSGILNANNALLAAAPVAVGRAPAIGGDRISLSAIPNPMRSGSDLVLYAPAGAVATMSVVDVHGRRIRDLGSPVDHRVHWDGTDAEGRRVPAGLYFATARVGSTRAARRLVVIE